MATSPAIAPETAPSIVGFLLISHSAKSQPISPAAAAVLVLMKAVIATSSIVNALPTLNPNHPNQISVAPSNVRSKLCGAVSLIFFVCRAQSRQPARLHLMKYGRRFLRRNQWRPACEANLRPKPSGRQESRQARPIAPKKDKCRKTHAFSKASGNNRCRKHGKRQLEHHIEGMRNRL